MRRTAALLAALALSGPLAATSWGSADGFTLTPSAREVSWQGEHVQVAVTPDLFGFCSTPAPAACQTYPLEVAVPPTTWETSTGGVEVSITWESTEDDFDLAVYDDAGALVGISATGTTTETVTVSQASGVYDIRVIPVAVTDSTYRGTARLDMWRDHPGSTRSLTYVSVHHEGQSVRPPSTRPARSAAEPLRVASRRTGAPAGEPTIGVDASGRAFITSISPLELGPGTSSSQTRVLRSTSGGRTWEDVTAERITGSSPITADPYLHVDELTGRVFSVDLLVAGAYVSSSDDGGGTWRPSLQLGEPAVNDHQTVTSGPPPPGMALLDPTFPRAFYYCSQKELAATCAVSADGGRTFRATGAPAYEVMPSPDRSSTCSTLHGHAVVDQEGRLLLPAGYCGEPHLAVSEDGGLTWTRTVVAQDMGAAGPQTSVAVDDTGNWYYLFQDRHHRLPWMVTSSDAGATWSRPVLVSPPGLTQAGWPTVVAGAAGRVAVLFPGTTGAVDDLTRPWDGWIAVTTDARAAAPVWSATTWNAPGDPVHRGECPLRCGTHYEFWDMTVAPGRGGALWGATVDSCTGLRACAERRGGGYDVDESTGFPITDGVAVDSQGVVFVQRSGPRLRP